MTDLFSKGLLKKNWLWMTFMSLQISITVPPSTRHFYTYLPSSTFCLSSLKSCILSNCPSIVTPNWFNFINYWTTSSLLCSSKLKIGIRLTLEFVAKFPRRNPSSCKYFFFVAWHDAHYNKSLIFVQKFNFDETLLLIHTWIFAPKFLIISP